MRVDSTTNVPMVAVDGAVEKKDPTGGRAVNGGMGGKPEFEGKSEEEVVESAL